MKPNQVTIRQDTGTLPEKAADSLSHLICLLAKPADITHCPHATYLNRYIRTTHHELNADNPLHTVLPNRSGTRISIVILDPGKSTFEFLTQARETIAAQRVPTIPTTLTLAVYGVDKALAGRGLEAMIAAALAADFALPSFKSTSKPPIRLKAIRITGHRALHGYVRTQAEAHGNNLSRWLTALPPNELTPRRYREQVHRLARARGWKVEFLDTKKLKARGAGAFLAVAQGSPEPDAGILHLCYTPKKKSSARPVALVGKGICFDTGGTNLKPARYMHGMHEDMEGSAVALGTLLALTELKVEFPVDCWLALAQNHIGPKAYKQNDIVRAANGTTVEVIHTDAEGRLVLADTLTFASRAKPSMILDFATLTGACVGALSTRMSGAVTNRLDIVPAIIEAGLASGERVWPFPLENDYDKALKSEIADVKQCTLDSDADHILAASFLKRFIEHDTPWVHVDLSAGNHKGGLAHIPSDVTGFGVRFALDLLLDRKITVNV